jgi:high-affinity iron transporter
LLLFFKKEVLAYDWMSPMLASLLIVFREVFEAGLIVGIVMAATEGVPGRAAWLAGGIGAGLLGAGLLAVFAGALEGALAGAGQEVFNAAILVAAVLMLGWHQIWMASHGRQLAAEMKAVGRDIALGQRSLFAMAVVVGVAVLREGAEVVLFLYGIAVSGHEGWVALLGGGLAGVALGCLVSLLLYRGLVAIPVHRLFAVTGWLIALLAAGMAGQAAAILAGADLIPAWGYQLWDTSWLLPEDSIPGRALHALVGYADRPMGVQLAAWAAVLATLLIGARLARSAPAPRKPLPGPIAALQARP